jgi:hypothetical protein
MKLRFYSLVLMAIVLSSMVACTKYFSRHKLETPLVVYPQPPDSTRIIYLTSISSSINVNVDRSKFAKFVLGEPEELPINKPYGITIHNSKIYICDIGMNGIDIIDLENKTFSYFTPEGKGKLRTPVNCSIDKDDNMFIADRGRQQIVVFDKTGKYINSFGGEGFNPSDVFCLNDTVWVCNPQSHKIVAYNRDSVIVPVLKQKDAKQFKDSSFFLFDFPESEIENPEYLSSPSNIFVTNDKVFVSDLADCKIKIYSKNGEFLSSIGSNGTQIGQFVRPKGIALDKENNLYVIDAAFENAQIFNRRGDPLMFFGGPYKGPGDMWLPVKIAIDYSTIGYFRKFANPTFDIKYLIFVTNQFGPSKVNVYAAVKPKSAN